MTKHYPLHHEDARPLYLEIPQDEYDRINSRIAELERMDTEHTLQIAKMNGYINHLEEQRRWRKFSEEKPELGDIVLVKLSERVKGHYFPMDVVRWDSTYELGEIEVSHWMPLPKFEEK